MPDQHFYTIIKLLTIILIFPFASPFESKTQMTTTTKFVNKINNKNGGMQIFIYFYVTIAITSLQFSIRRSK